jgi:hypothetical protein
MKKAAILCLALFAVVANANDIQFWFSTEANVQTAATTGPLNPIIPGAAGASTRLYLYANTPGTWVDMYDPNEGYNYVGWATDNTWEGMALDLLFQGDVVLGADNKVLNNAAGGLARWNTGSDLDWTPINGVAVSERGIGGANNGYNGGSGGLFDAKQYCTAPHQAGQSGILTSQVGWIQATQSATPHESDLFLVVGQQGVARRQGAVNLDRVYFGIGDAGLMGNAFGTHSAVYDAHFTPEPASLVLLALAGLALRRR